MGVCGSGRKSNDDEVWQGGSFSGRSSFSGGDLDLNAAAAGSGNIKEEQDTFDQDQMKNLQQKVARQRKRLTVQGTGALISKQTTEQQKQELQKFEKTEAKQQNAGFQDCHYVALSKRGYVPYDEKVNQDSLICIERVEHNIPGLDMHFFGVLDGHGHYGRDVSQYVTSQFPVELIAELARFKNVKELTNEVVTDVLTKAIDETHKKLLKQNIQLAHSGTTFCGSLIFNNTIYTANVGDSQGFILANGDNSKPYKIHDLNYLHNPDHPVELKRIKARGGVVSQIPGLDPSEAGPYRIWLPDMTGPGLAMARSLGDQVAHSIGAIHLPSIDIQKVDASCKYVLWASDGVFEFLTTDDVAEIITTGKKDLKTIAKSIVKRSVKMWRQFDQVVDDITVVLLQLPEIKVSE